MDGGGVVSKLVSGVETASGVPDLDRKDFLAPEPVWSRNRAATMADNASAWHVA